MLKVAKFIIGAILAQGVSLGVVIGLVYLIPIRGTELSMIVCPVVAVVVLGLTFLSAKWAFGGGV